MSVDGRNTLPWFTLPCNDIACKSLIKRRLLETCDFDPGDTRVHRFPRLKASHYWGPMSTRITVANNLEMVQAPASSVSPLTARFQLAKGPSKNGDLVQVTLG